MVAFTGDDRGNMEDKGDIDGTDRVTDNFDMNYRIEVVDLDNEGIVEDILVDNWQES